VREPLARGKSRSCGPNPDVETIHCNVVLTGQPTDPEARQFEARIGVVSGIGISYGREPQDVIIAGTRNHCESVRLAFRSKPHAFYAEEAPADRPVQGANASVVRPEDKEPAALSRFVEDRSPNPGS
jgi:hypothetical protein